MDNVICGSLVVVVVAIVIVVLRHVTNKTSCMYIHLLVSTRKKLLVYIDESSKTYNKQNCNEKTGQKFNHDE